MTPSESPQQSGVERPERVRFARRKACPLCDSTDSKRSRRLAVPHILRCGNCHFSYRVVPINPLDTPQRSARELAAIDASRRGMFKDVIGRFGPPPSNNLLVDIGASSGFFVEFAAAQGWNAVGIEIGASLAAIGRDLGRNLVVGDAEEIPLRSGSAAVVTLWDVLDQFDRPGRAIQEMARVLRPGGLLWLRVRHGAIHEFMRSQSWLPTQLSVIQSNLLSPRCLTHALTHAGFDDIRVGVAASSSGDPYASVRPGTQARLLQFAKRSWDAAAMVGAFVSAGSLVISPSITVLARREDTPVATE